MNRNNVIQTSMGHLKSLEVLRVKKKKNMFKTSKVLRSIEYTFLPRTRSPKTTAKLVQNNVYCFLNITIFRLAVPAFFRFTDVTELMQESQYYIDGECRKKNCLKGRGGNDVQHKHWKGKILRIWITIIRHGCLGREVQESWLYLSNATPGLTD